MKRKQINVLLICLSLAIIFVIARDFIGNKAGKNKANPYELNLDEYRKVDSTRVLYHETVTFPVQSDSPKGIAVQENEILVLTADRLIRYDYTGRELSSASLPDTANCLTTAAGGSVWVGMLHAVILLDRNGKIGTRWPAFDSRSVLTSMAASPKFIYVADAGNRIIYQCTPEGQIVSRIGEKNEEKGIPGYIIPSPYMDVAIDQDGFLWAANTGRHSLENYNKDGSLRSCWGVASMKIDGFIGCCNPAQFAILPDNSFITAEKGIPRIKLYDQHGAFLGIVATPAQFSNGWYAPDVATDASERILALDIDRKQVRIFEKNPDGNK